MFINKKYVTGCSSVLAKDASLPSPVFANYIQGKSLEDFKDLGLDSNGVVGVHTDYVDVKDKTYLLGIRVVDDKVAFTGSSHHLLDTSKDLLEDYNWTPLATIKEINEFKVEL